MNVYQYFSNYKFRVLPDTSDDYYLSNRHFESSNRNVQRNDFELNKLLFEKKRIDYLRKKEESITKTRKSQNNSLSESLLSIHATDNYSQNSSNVIRKTSIRSTVNNVFTEKLDSICTNGYAVVKYKYDKNGNIICEDYGNLRREYFYDDNGNKLVELQISDDSGSNYKYEYTFDNQNRQTLDVFYMWDNNSFVQCHKTERSFDEYGNENMFADYVWSENKWVGERKHEIIYNQNGRELMHAYYDSWANDDWVGNYKYEMDYDAHNNLILEAWYEWTDDQWMGTWKGEYAYNENGQKTLDALYDKPIGGVWQGNCKYEFDYDEQGRLTLEAYAGSWENGIWLDNREYYYYENDAKILYKGISIFKNGNGIYKRESNLDMLGNPTVTILSIYNNNQYDTIWKSVDGWDGKVHISYELFEYDNNVETKSVFTNYSFENGIHKLTYYNAMFTRLYTVETTYNTAGNIKLQVQEGEYKTEYFYDEKDREIRHIYNTWVVSEWNPQTIVEYAYDQQGNLILDSTKYYEWGIWQGWKIEYFYDIQNGKTVITDYVLESDEWVERVKDEWTYDEKDRLVQICSYEWQNGIWHGTRNSILNYDSNDNIILNEGYNWSDVDGWIPNFKYEYIFDNNDRKLMSSLYSWDNGEWKGQWKDETIYEQNDKKITGIHYDSWTNGEWTSGHKIINVYDDNDKQISYADFTLVDGEWSGNNQNGSAFNSSGKTILSFYLSGWSSGNWENGTKHEYGYNDDGNKTFDSLYNWVNNNWTINSKTEFVYDEYQNVIEERYYRPGIENEDLLHVSSRCYVYDTTSDASTIAGLKNHHSKILYDYSCRIWEDGERQEYQGQEYFYSEFTLESESYKVGDANGDTYVDVGDISAIAGHILGTEDPNFVEKAADANEDTFVDVGDISTIAGWILDGSAVNRAPTRNNSLPEVSFSTSPCYMAPGSVSMIPICVSNTTNAFTSFQLDVELPEGLILEDVLVNEERVPGSDYFNYAMMDNNNVRLLDYSLDRSFVSGNEGAIAYLVLRADENMTEEMCSLKLTNGVFACGSTVLRADNQKLAIVVSEATGIESLDKDGKTMIYDLNGRYIGRNVEKVSKGMSVLNGRTIYKRK